MINEEKKRWSEEEFSQLVKDKENRVPYQELAKKYGRSIDAIKQKLHRGYSPDKRIKERPEFLDDKEKVKQFKEDYQDKKVSGESIMIKYKIDTKQKLYKIAKELGVRKNKSLINN